MKLISFVYSTILLLIVLKLRYNKINLTSFYPLFIGVISAAVFGFIDSIFFLTAEKSLLHHLIHSLKQVLYIQFHMLLNYY